MTTDTDRELLEWAAKAASISFRGYDIFYENFSAHDKKLDVCYQWNPLTDDGDALRLAVKLRLLWDEMELFDLHFEPDSDDPYAATRRAIVRAAAEIGKSMS